MDYLIENQFEEIYLFCTAHHLQVKAHVEERAKVWRRKCEVHFLYNFKCQSLGDAMREIDAKGLVRAGHREQPATRRTHRAPQANEQGRQERRDDYPVPKSVQ